MDLHIRQYLTKAESHKDVDALKTAYDLIVEGTKENSPSGTRWFRPELCVLCAEQALQLGCKEISEDCLKVYFKGKPPTNQFLARAYLCQGQLSSPPVFGSVEDIENAVIYFLKAMDMSKEQPRYHFLVFNASVLYFQTIRPLLQPGFRQHLVTSLTRVVKALEGVGEADYSWRAQLMIHLVECLVEAGQGKEAASFAKHTSDFIEAQAPDLYPRIFSLQVRFNLMDFSKTRKTETSLTLSVIYKMQKLKYQVEGGEARKDCAAKLREIFLLLAHPSLNVPHGSSSGLTERVSPIPPTERDVFLFELAHLSLQLKHPQVASDCLRELETAGVSDVGLLVKVECLQCELELHKQGKKIEEYSKNNVEAHLRLIRRLDQLLQEAVRAGDAQIIQAVCSTQWNVCLPLLQHNLRKNIRSQLIRVAQALEDTNSLLLEMRSQVHNELSEIEAEEDRLEPALEHLHKALGLDQRGVNRERLSVTLNLLQMQGLLYETPQRMEDRAAVLIEQAKRGSQKDDVENKRSLLVSAGIALASDTFQVVLDADSNAKLSFGCHGQSLFEQLSSKAQHHTTCVQMAYGYLEREGKTNDNERARLWAALAKAARKQEIWDVCRAACRFCLLYEDGRWKISQNDCEQTEESLVEGHCGESRLSVWRHSPERELLRLLAEIHFINAEATVQKLRLEGMQLNQEVLPPEDRGKIELEKNPQWTIYREWIQGMSEYATSNFLQAAELGAELCESWIVQNAAVYLWNYNNHILTSGGQRKLLATFLKLVDLLKLIGHIGDPVLLVLLCNTVAQGLILPWNVSADRAGQEKQESQKVLPVDKAKKVAGKGAVGMGSVQGFSLDQGALLDIKKAQELCEYALRLSNGNTPVDAVPIAARKQVITTWVRIKQLLQQQIGQKLDVDDEGVEGTVKAMTCVLVGTEMLLCNENSSLMQFSVPTLSMLVQTATDCRWTDPAVELQVWTHLVHFAHQTQDHDLVLRCSRNALQLETAAVKRVKATDCSLYSYNTVQEMLSSVACMRGLVLLQQSNGHPVNYRAALRTLQSSVSYAEGAGSHALCIATARHFWNACLPLVGMPLERQHLRQPVEAILRAMLSTSAKDKVEGQKKSNIQAKLTQVHRSLVPSSQPVGSSLERPEDNLTLRVALYSLLFHIHADRADWKSGLQVLEQALREMPRTRQRLLLFKESVVVKASLGQSIVTDMQKLCKEGEEHVSHVWHRVAQCSEDLAQQLACFQNAITSLQHPQSSQRAECQWQKIDYLLEFGQWLYCNHFPVNDALHQIQWAIDLILNMEVESVPKISELKGRERMGVKVPTEELAAEKRFIPVERQAQIGVQGAMASLCLTDLRDVKQLEGLVRAHTLLAFMVDRASCQYQQHCILAYGYVLRIWQVSLATAGQVINEGFTTKNPDILPRPARSATPRKDKAKKSKEPPPPPPIEEKPKRRVVVDVVPTSSEEWALFYCPEEVRQAFKYDTSPFSVNRQSIANLSQSLFFLDLLEKELQSAALLPLTLPVLHLAEVIAHDLMERKSLSDLYRLRIAKGCSSLGLSTSAAYHEKCVCPILIHEEERVMCRKASISQGEKSGHQTCPDGNKVDKPLDSSGSLTGTLFCGPRAQDVWIDEAEICLSMGQYQSARLLLAEANLVAKEIGDRTGEAKSFYLLAVLANHERKHGQALALLEAAQAIGGDEHLWYSVVMCLAKTTVDMGGKDKISQACCILKRASCILKSVLEERPNRVPVLKFLLASLATRRAVLQVQSVSLSHPEDNPDTKSVTTLMASCDILSQTTNEFLALGYREHGAEAIREHAEALRILAKHTDNQRHLLDSYFLMHQAVTIQEEVVMKSLSLLALQESCQTGPITLPVMRKLACLRLALADLALDMLEKVCTEERGRALAQDSKDSLQCMVEDFVRMTPDLTSGQQEWLCTGKTLGQVALTQLEAVNSFFTASLETRAKSMCMLGRCLRLLAVQKDPLYFSTLWEVGLKEENRMELKQDFGEEEEELLGGNSTASKVAEQRQHTSKTAELQRRRISAQQMLAQASETLAQAIGLSLQHKFTHILADASRNMLECYGQFDPKSTGQYLALFQSCCCSAMMDDVLQAACTDTSLSQLAALLNLHRNLREAKEECPNYLLKDIEENLLSLSMAYKQLSINPNHLGILNELPSNFRILLLQHTADRSVLYGAFYEKAKPSESQKGKAVHLAGPMVCTRVAKANVDPEQLSRLLASARSFKELTMLSLIKDQYQHGGGAPLREMAQEHAATQSSNNTPNKIASHLNSVVLEMENYLHPILNQFDFSCFRLQTPLILMADTTRPKDKEDKSAADKAPPADLGECVILLADRLLMELPLEALSSMQGDRICSVSRDFSLQLLHSRLHREDPVDSDNRKETKDVKGVKGKGDPSKPIKVMPVNRVLPPDALPVDTHNFKYLVDLYNEAGDSELSTPEERMRQILEAYSQFTPLWEGVMGSEHTPSISELEQWLSKCSAFIFNGLEHFLAYIPPSRLVALNISECQIAILFDLVQNTTSVLRQAKIDAQKCAEELALERPLETAVLLSLSGVRSIMLNQWHTTLQWNALHMDAVIKSLLKTGMTSGQAVHALRRSVQNPASEGAGERDGERPGQGNVPPEQPEIKKAGSVHNAWQNRVDPSAPVFNLVIYGLPNLVVT